MPTYEYECSNGHRFEVVQPITEDPLKRCQVCNSDVRRLISAAAFILKGGGWYSDGYGSGSSKPSSSANGSSDGGAAEGSSDSSSDTSSKDSKSSSSGASSEDS